MPNSTFRLQWILTNDNHQHIMNDDGHSRQLGILPLTHPRRKSKYSHRHTLWLLQELFTMKNPKVHYHDHISGEYLFAVCNNCNMQLITTNSAKKTGDKRQRDQMFFPQILFHNLLIVTTVLS